MARRLLTAVVLGAMVACQSGAQPEVGSPLPLGIEVANADAAEALRTFATSRGLGVVARVLPTEKRNLSVQPSSREHVLAQVADAYGLSAVVWRGFVLAGPRQTTAGVPAALAASLSAEIARMLLREEDPAKAASDPVPDAIRALVRASPESQPALLRAACWMAAPEFHGLLRRWDAADRGVMRVTFFGRTGLDGYSLIPPDDPCPYHLRLVAPAGGDRDDEQPLALQSHGPTYDPFREKLVELKATVAFETYQRRLVEASERELRPWTAAPGWARETNLGEGTIAGLETVVTALRQQGLAVECAAAAAGIPVMVAARRVKASDLCLALAIVCGLPLAPGEASVLLDDPRTALELVFAALPLPWRAGVAVTGVERDLARQELIPRLCAALGVTDQTKALAYRPQPLSALPPEARTLARCLAGVSVAGLYERWTQNLPDRAGRVPLWLYENQQIGRYELAAPGQSEYVGGELYAALKKELTGKEVTFVEPDKDAREWAPPTHRAD